MVVLVGTIATALPATAYNCQPPVRALHFHPLGYCSPNQLRCHKSSRFGNSCSDHSSYVFRTTFKSLLGKRNLRLLARLGDDIESNQAPGRRSGQFLGRFLKRGNSGETLSNDSQEGLRESSATTRPGSLKDRFWPRFEVLEDGREPPLRPLQIIKSEGASTRDRLVEAAVKKLNEAKKLASKTSNYFSSVDASPGTPLLPFLGDSFVGLGCIVLVAIVLATWWRRLRRGKIISNTKVSELTSASVTGDVEAAQSVVAAPVALSMLLQSEMKKKESAEWLNMVLGKVWNLYRRKLENTLVEAIQPVIDEIPEKPPHVERVVLKQFLLGDEPVALRTIERRTSRRANDLQYHVGLRYTGNSRMVLSIALKLGFLPIIPIPISIRGLDLDGEVWVKLRLIPTEPWVGTATWAFVSPPKVTLALAPFRFFNLMAVPLLNVFLTQLLTKDLPRLFVRPNKQVINYLKGETAGPLSRDFKDGIFEIKGFTGELSITLLEARKLNYFPIGKTDPYVVFLLGEQAFRSKRNSKTSITGPPGAPVWNQDFRMLVTDPATQKLRIRVRDFVGFLKLTTITVGYIELMKGKGVVDAVCVPSGGVVVGSGGKRKRASGNGIREGLLHQLQWLCGKNNARVQGRILTVACKGEEMRVVVLVDLYLPPSAWMGTGFWKSGATAAAALSHMSCDWEKRRMLLTVLKSGQEILLSDNVWGQGGCHVLGCEVHQALSESMKARFDLHSLFKSLPTYKSEDRPEGLKLLRDEFVNDGQTGIWDVPDEIITSIFSRLLPKDLHNVAAVCRYTRLMAVPIMPCMHLRLFPHQLAAVRWMLQRENRPGVMAHPLHKKLETEDAFPFFLDAVSGELSPEIPLEVQDFRGGLFCDEPGLGKTVTALSLILKTQGASADPPSNTEVFWVPRGPGEKMGYYEVNSNYSLLGGSALKRSMLLKARRNQEFARESDRVTTPDMSAKTLGTPSSCPVPEIEWRQIIQPGLSVESMSQNSSLVLRPTRNSRKRYGSLPAKSNLGPTRCSIRVKRKLGESFDMASEDCFLVDDISNPKRTQMGTQSLDSTISSGVGSNLRPLIVTEGVTPLSASTSSGSLSDADIAKRARSKRSPINWIYEEENWAQCDACFKWRKLPSDAITPKDDVAWFCSLNPDSMYQKCTVPQEADPNTSVKSLAGFYKHGSNPGQAQNVAFFANVLKENVHLYAEGAKRPVVWLANLNSEQLAKLASVGLTVPREARGEGFMAENSGCSTLFTLFGLLNKKPKKGAVKWFYPKGLDGLVFDTVALREATRKPRDDATRLYLSRATLIVVTQSLVEHWRYQIAKHTTPGQLRVYVWTDHKKPAAAHILAWDYDIVITTFHRLSSEWSVRENSVLMRIHWLRIMLDEGHTLGASLSLTNKLQMAISLHASRRWILTGTPTPNTPSSQAAYLRPMLEFLHEGIFSKQQKLWDNAILRPFEGGCEEGRSRLVQLLHRTMISSRKSDLCTIPPCIRKVTLLNFTEAHAATYNELVVTVQRNILLADWRDPSHVESLLNPKQWKFRSTTLRNTRLSCCVAGHIKVGMSGEDVHETMDLLVSDYGLAQASELFYKIEKALTHGEICDRCQAWCRLPIITPCCHLLCLSCVAMDCEKCTMSGCGHPYKMQSPAELARPENPTPKWPVPQDLIELQPSYAQDDWDPDWHATSSSKVSYLVNQLKVIQDNNLMQQYSSGPLSEAKVNGFLSTTWQTYSHNSSCSLPFKAIVFSQFLEHINVIEEQLKGAGIQHVGMYSPMHSTNRMKSLVTFQNDPGCTVLVMDASASLGLDLSFVTHVYLMEPIWDGSVEEQVVSRAHRMGASRPVLVETLAMNGTIEQQMLEFLQDPSGKGRLKDGHDSSGKANYSLENSCLTNLNFVRTMSASASA